MFHSPLKVLPLSPLSCGSMLARVDGALRAVVIVKATFSLAHERMASPIEPAPLVEDDQYGGGGRKGSLLSASDFVPFLPSCGVVLTGAAWAPHSKLVESLSVRFAIFRDTQALLEKQLYVYGTASPKNPSPWPFRMLPLVYEGAYGGPGVPENPVGIGADGDGPFASIVSPRDLRCPAGFGPIAREWSPRVEALGGYVEASDHVEVPEHFSWAALHAAPEDQCIDYLRGDEWIVLDGMNQHLPRVQTRLPVARAEVKYERRDEPGELQAVPLVADTLAIHAEKLVASITWRGHIEIASADEAREIRAYAGLELGSVPIAWPPATDRSLPEPRAPRRPSAWPDLQDSTNEREARAIREALSDVRAPPATERTHETFVDVRAFQAALPFATGAASGPEPSAEVSADPLPARAPRVREVTLMSIAVAQEPPEIEAPDTVTGVIDATELRSALPWPGAAEPASPAAVSAPRAVEAPRRAVATAARPPSEMRLQVEAKHRAGESLVGLALAHADLSGANLAHVDLHEQSLQGARLEGADLAGANLVGADLSDARLDDADLGGADLGRATLVGTTFAKALLEGANLERARGERARFTDAHASGAKFSRGAWDEADFMGAGLRGADFTGSTLTAARFAAADLGDARFNDARGERTTFESARLGGAQFGSAALLSPSFAAVHAPESNWDNAAVDGASFEGADLEGASFFRTGASGCRFEGARLRNASMQRFSGAKCDFSNADLTRANLRQARLAHATFDEARMREAQAALADFSGASMKRADFSSAVVRGANFTGADLSGARLDGADFREANLENARLVGASRKGTQMGGAITTGVVDGTETEVNKGRAGS